MPSPTVTTGWVRLTLCFEAHPGTGQRQGWDGDRDGAEIALGYPAKEVGYL